MNRSVIYPLTILFLLNLFYSCEKEVIIDVKKAEPRLVMRSEITNWPEDLDTGPGIIYWDSAYPQKVPNFLILGLSSSVNDKPQENLQNCKVVLMKNSIAYDTIFYDQTKEYYALFENEQDFPEAGDELEIEVFCGDQFVSSKSKMPNKVPIKSVDTSSVYALFIKENELYGSSTLTFQDPPGEDNYYEIVVTQISPPDKELVKYSLRTDEAFITGLSHYSSSFNGGPPSTSKSLLFTDKTFSGEEKSVSFYFPMVAYMGNGPVDFPHKKLNYHLRNVSKEYYEFETNKRIHLITSDVNFLFGASEPQNVSSNVENGLGVFGVYNHSQKNFFFPERTINF
ncbi:DUF4249 family protein [Brumimicrobium oceani]|uniref:DUF4249 domain-containing protein n=1 Tax=Brumimicrobium oceani TaxID=2100725 RepID=A0A2U2XB64_9FLAO|nr:DUF4249 family protein [Brumimicrobium oceani]PWH85028.1 hypothetical protein DIT68_11700 [Brumimicrobium oceani]